MLTNLIKVMSMAFSQATNNNKKNTLMHAIPQEDGTRGDTKTLENS